MKAPFGPDRVESILREIEAREGEIVSLTQDLIRFPTVNPPGEAYRPCAEYLGNRLAKRGFEIEYVRAHGSRGDNETYPRIM